MSAGPREVPVIVLAAGDASRFGSPKQLAPWKGTTLLKHAARTALDARVGPVLVVLGAMADRMSEELAGLGVTTHEHHGWREGMGSTIAAAIGVQRQRWSIAPAVIVMACDQPRLTATHLQALVDRHRSVPCDAVASSYAGTIGIPALFDTRLAARLDALQGERGAKRLLESVRTESVPLPGGELDIDRPGDLTASN